MIIMDYSIYSITAKIVSVYKCIYVSFTYKFIFISNSSIISNFTNILSFCSKKINF